jgi:hypothetical protein
MDFDRFFPKTVGEALSGIDLSDEDLRLAARPGGPSEWDLAKMEREAAREERRKTAQEIWRRRQCLPNRLKPI